MQDFLKLKYRSPSVLLKKELDINIDPHEDFVKNFFDQKGKMINLQKINHLLEQKYTRKMFFVFTEIDKKIKVYELFCRLSLHKSTYATYFVHPYIFQDILYDIKTELSPSGNTTCRPFCPNVTKPYCDWC